MAGPVDSHVKVYRLTMAAIARSGVEIPKLRIYSKTAGCGVSLRTISQLICIILSKLDLRVSWSVKGFALSYSMRVD